MSARARWRAVVVDDEPSARDAVRGFLEAEPSIEVVGEAGDGRTAVDAVRALRPELLFLDVQMPEVDGFAVLDALGPDVPPGVVFVTAHDEHALRAFEVHALDFVLKPFGAARFSHTVGRAVRRLEAEDALTSRRTLEALIRGRRSTEGLEGAPAPIAPSTDASDTADAVTRIGVRQGTRTILVEVASVEWIEADGDYARLHLEGRSHLVSERLHRLERMLEGRFLRIHRSIMVNLARVAELDRDPDGGGSLTLRSGVRLRVARARWSELGAALGLPSG